MAEMTVTGEQIALNDPIMRAVDADAPYDIVTKMPGGVR